MYGARTNEKKKGKRETRKNKPRRVLFCEFPTTTQVQQRPHDRRLHVYEGYASAGPWVEMTNKGGEDVPG